MVQIRLSQRPILTFDSGVGPGNICDCFRPVTAKFLALMGPVATTTYSIAMQKIKATLLSKLAILAFIILSTPVLFGAMPMPYMVKNTTNEALGCVTLHHVSGTTEVSVTTPGNWVTSVGTPVNAVTVNGQTVTYPNQAQITLPGSGHTGRVYWQTTSAVEVIDLEMGS